ncbi:MULTISPECIES: OBAP family protein [Pseudomonas syringae group genomosp. 2]|uniref:Putative lipoprotein n=1 Tax=Pseudomonas savastanoi pv. phaseolicola TaxID=319 RepID=Q4LBL3_PSESH|nr:MULTISPECIES: OBAP family protein [Pseudomonas syringae group genomosp. 2]KPB66736.1 putative lipoprotein [Pseudomonas savastanoi pv. phaseolicola]CAI36085.1 putative lipoprotein [Pseudomonas savastanoi pv. phaseolicola]
MPQIKLTHLALPIACSLIGACSGVKTESPVDAPGRPQTVGTRALEAGAAMIQSKPPLDALNAYLDGFHFYNGHPKMQMEAHHYCAILNEDVIQCVIYDGNTKQAKIMGVEYIINETLFAALPSTEKAMWHSHGYEVSSGQLVAPGIPASAEHALMERLAHTYGKTWHTWHTDQSKKLPLGVPQLMMGFTADGQAEPAMLLQRNHRLGIDAEAIKAQRSDIQIPKADAGADGWQHGNVIQLNDPTDVRSMPHTTNRLTN